MTDPDPSQQARLESLRKRTAAPASGRRRRRHPAVGSRIAAAGMSTSAMFAIIAAFGLAVQEQPQTAPASTPVSAPSALAGAAPKTAVQATPIEPAGAQATAPANTQESPVPIQLTADRVVRTVEAPSAAPAVTTNGSR